LSSITVNQKRLPGDLAIWIFILAELTVFAALFLMFSVSKSMNAEMFAEGQATLHPLMGLINTLSLITSSYFVAKAVLFASQGQLDKSAKWIWMGVAIASIYIVTKFIEYQELISLGYNLRTNTFYMMYFFITFFHFMHVLMGIVILIVVANKAKKGGYADDITGVETGASYWHMVDMVWVVLFPLIYVIK
jgi:nitric oxide reductase NorE protein